MSAIRNALTTRYRWPSKIVGLEDKFKLAASTLEPMAVLEGVAAGLTLEIIVQAINGGSQSVASDPIVVTMVAVATTEAEAKPAALLRELAPLAATAPNGSGNGSLAVNRVS